MGIIDFSRGQRDPADISLSTYPGDPSGIPAKTDDRAGCDLDDRRRWRPVPSAVDNHPVAIMVRNISERLIGHPDLIAVIVSPSADGKGLPGCRDSGGPPEFVVVTLIIDLFPRSGLFQIVGIILKLRREVFDPFPLDFNPFGPHGIPRGVPVIPRGIHLTVTG
jgi:hypothetical protein